MFKTIFEKLKDIVSERISYFILSLLGILATGGFSFGILSDPFYHEGWLQAHRAWMPVFVLASVLSVILCASKRAAIIMLIVVLSCAIAFAILYQSPNYAEGNWPFIAWLLHGITFALSIGVLAFAVHAVIEFWTARRRPRTSTRRVRRSRT